MRDKIRNLGDRFWLWSNRKPESRGSVWGLLVTPWVFAAFLIAILVAIIVKAVQEGLWAAPLTPLAISQIVLAVVVGYAIYSAVLTGLAMMHRYAEVVYQRYLEVRQEGIATRRARLEGSTVCPSNNRR